MGTPTYVKGALGFIWWLIKAIVFLGLMVALGHFLWGLTQNPGGCSSPINLNVGGSAAPAPTAYQGIPVQGGINPRTLATEHPEFGHFLVEAPHVGTPWENISMVSAHVRDPKMMLYASEYQFQFVCAYWKPEDGFTLEVAQDGRPDRVIQYPTGELEQRTVGIAEHGMKFRSPSPHAKMVKCYWRHRSLLPNGGK